MPIVRIAGDALSDWESFHDTFAEVLGFPDFYGRNMNAWIDCLTSLDAPEDGMTSIHASAVEPLVIHIDNANSIPAEIFDGLTECAGFVNWRRIEVGEPAVLALSFWRSERTR